MHLEGDCTTQDNSAYIVYILKWNLQVDVGYTTGLQLSCQMYFYFLFYCDKNNLGS